jgi:Protein tyrosine and serine/threonine kinase
VHLNVTTKYYFFLTCDFILFQQQENQLVHGRIRCSSLEVTRFSQDREFVVKLGDPGIPIDYNINDIPWIPIEHYENLNESRKNLKADIWAYATTLWEIFSLGTSPLADLTHADLMNFFKTGKSPGLSKPIECISLPAIHNLMTLGWDNDPDKRPQAQIICANLVDTSKFIFKVFTFIITHEVTHHYSLKNIYFYL